MENKATIDLETRSACDLLKHGSWIYSKHPTTSVLCMAYHVPGHEIKLWHCAHPDIGIEETGPPIELFNFIKNGGLVEAHNSFFERVMWENVLWPIHNWPKINSSQWRCSAAKSNACSIPRSLEKACQSMGLDIEKDMAGNRLMRKLCKPKKPTKEDIKEWEADENNWYISEGSKILRPMGIQWHEDPEELKGVWNYCIRDVEAEISLSKTLPELPDKELKLWQLDQTINITGIPIDLELARASLDIADKNKEKLNTDLYQMTGLSSGTQRAKIKRWLLENDKVELPDTTADTIDKFLDMDDIPGRTKQILKIVKSVNRTSIRKYKSMIDRTDPQDSRARDILMYHGASTGRWSGQGIQVHSFPRGLSKNSQYYDKKTNKWFSKFDMDLACDDILEGDENWLEAMYEGGVIEALSSAARGTIVPSSNKDLITADYSAIEARCVLWLAGDEEALEVFRRNGDIYCDMAEAIYGYPINKIDHADERQFGKTAIVGLGYGMGFLTFFLTCRKFGIFFSIEKVKNIMKQYYNKYMTRVKNYLYPVRKVTDMEIEPIEDFHKRVRQASKSKKRLLEKGENPAQVMHELALMKYTVDIYRRKYSLVKDLWTDQEIFAIAAVNNWEHKLKKLYETNEKINKVWDVNTKLSGDCQKFIIRDEKGNIEKDLRWIIPLRDSIESNVVGDDKFKWFVRGGFLCCELPSGRLLRYRDPSLKNTETPWGTIKESLRYMSVNDGRWVRTMTYGGKIVENQTQAVARDIMADAMLNLVDSDYSILMTSHDEIVAEVDTDKGCLAEFENLLCSADSWAEDCPIIAEASRYKRYRK